MPVNSQLRNWISILRCRATVILKQFDAEHGTLQFRLDGSNQPLSCLERLQDFVFRLTMRGTQITRKHWIPVFPDPPLPPLRRKQ